MKIVCVASSNPVKLRATREGFERMYPGMDFEIRSTLPMISLPQQPSSDIETLQCALLRAHNIRELAPGCSVEVLIPDFKGSLEALKIVMDARPEILNHNVETVPSLFKQVQPQDRYEWAAATLSNAKKLDPEVLTKSGIMLGLGETLDEVKQVMRDQRAWGVEILTIGQYLAPSKRHLPIERYYTPEEFAELKAYGLALGFRWVESGPLVRSSYHAAEQVRALSVVHRELYGE